MPESRRDVLRDAAAGVSLAWGGLRIFAGQNVPVQGDQFIYGSQVYQPPNPLRSMRREVFRTIAQEHQFNIIRCYPPWAHYHLAPERFDFEEIEEIMRYCDGFGLKVLMGIVIEVAPYWLGRAHPETRFVDVTAQARVLNDEGSGLCLDWEPVQEAARRFVRELIKVLAPHRSMYAYDIWNEPQH